MGYSYKKLDAKVLMFDCVEDKDKIIFNQYIMRRENLNRIKKEVDEGMFNMSLKTLMRDLCITRRKAENLIKEFEALGIIRRIVKGNKKNKYSIYEYCVNFDKNLKKHNNNTNNNINNIDSIVCVDNSDCNDFMDFDDICSDFENSSNYDLDNNAFKIDNKNKKLNNNNIHSNVVGYLNEKSKKNFKATTPKTIRIIDTRLKEGFLEKDFYKVIDIKCSQWLHTSMQKFIRPETLFSNKFEGYLNEFVEDFKEDKEFVEPINIDFDY